MYSWYEKSRKFEKTEKTKQITFIFIIVLAKHHIHALMFWFEKKEEYTKLCPKFIHKLFIHGSINESHFLLLMKWLAPTDSLFFVY